MSKTPRFSLKQISYFVALAESATLSAAALRLNISQSALTEAIDALETQLGIRLTIRRRAQGVSLTKGGEDLLIYCRALIETAGDLQATAEGRSNQLTGRVSLGCYATLAPFLLPGLIEAFRLRHPEADLQIIEGSGQELEALLHTGACDIALLYGYNLGASTRHDVVYSVSPRIVLPASHSLADQDDIALAEIIDEPLVQFAIEPALSNTAAIFADMGLTPRKGQSAMTIELVRSLVAQGLGYAVLLHHPETGLSYNGQPLAVRSIRGASHRQQVVLAQSSHLRRSRRNEMLRRFCLSCFDPAKGGFVPAQAIRD